MIETSTHYKWNCEFRAHDILRKIGTTHNANVRACGIPKTAGGQCNLDAKYACNIGVATDRQEIPVTGHPPQERHQWRCKHETNNVKSDLCDLTVISPINGVCNNSVKFGCTTGPVTNQATQWRYKHLDVQRGARRHRRQLQPDTSGWKMSDTERQPADIPAFYLRFWHVKSIWQRTWKTEMGMYRRQWKQ